MSSTRSRLPLLLAVAALAAAAGTASADWIVTKDGAWLETRGPWKVEGRQVIFTLPNGTLSALRTETVDLDASAVATAREAEKAERTAEPAPEPAPKPEPVLVLTESDIPPSYDAGTAFENDPGVEAGEAGDAGAAEGSGEKAGSGSVDLEVISWDKVQNANRDGLQVAGTLKNVGGNSITSPSLTAAVYDEDGRLIATSEGSINAGLIAAGRTANFRLSFPGVTDFVAIKFDAQGRGFRERTEEGESGAQER